MAFVFPQKVLFKHCDPAGLVFYPRFFEMLNDVVEAFFDIELRYPFETMHPDFGVPTVQIQSTYGAPSRHGDMLEFRLVPTKIGTTSLDLGFAATCGGENRLTARSTLVHIGATGRPVPWPAPVKDKLLTRIGDPL